MQPVPRLVPLALAVVFVSAPGGAAGAGRLAAAAETLVGKKVGDRRPAIVFLGDRAADRIPGLSETLADADRFLVSLGRLAAKDTP
jgi:hypothetical protein